MERDKFARRKLLKAGCLKRNLETFEWKMKSNLSLSRWLVNHLAQEHKPSSFVGNE